jgi:N-acetylglucosamine-6-sulfatase
LHNGVAKNNSLSGNCYGDDWRHHAEHKTYAVTAQQVGYRTAFAGKYLNQYGTSDQAKHEIDECTRNNNDTTKRCDLVPKGWDHWLGLVGNSRYYNYTTIQSDDAGKTIQVKQHTDRYDLDYFPDLLANRTLHIIDEFTNGAEASTDHDQSHNHRLSPFLIVVSWPTPHSPFTGAPQDAGRFKDKKAHRTPNYNTTRAQNLQKHWMMRRLAPIDDESERWIDDHYRMRSEAVQSVDRHIEKFVKKIARIGQLDNTVIMYTSDNGWQFGQHRITGDKRQLYEHNIRVPMLVRGPGIKSATQIQELVLNIDIAPTIAEIVTGDPQSISYMDGRSFWPLLVQDQIKDDPVQTDHPKTDSTRRKQSTSLSSSYSYPWRHDFLVSYHGEAAGPCGMWNCPPESPEKYHGGDAWNNTYHCVRTLRTGGYGSSSIISSTLVETAASDTQDAVSTMNNVGENTIYCKFEDDENFVEFYDLDSDPWQLHNAFHQLTPDKQFSYEARLEQLKRCSGDTCRMLGFEHLGMSS